MTCFHTQVEPDDVILEVDGRRVVTVKQTKAALAAGGTTVVLKLQNLTEVGEGCTSPAAGDVPAALGLYSISEGTEATTSKPTKLPPRRRSTAKRALFSQGLRQPKSPEPQIPMPSDATSPIPPTPKAPKRPARKSRGSLAERITVANVTTTLMTQLKQIGQGIDNSVRGPRKTVQSSRIRQLHPQKSLWNFTINRRAAAQVDTPHEQEMKEFPVSRSTPRARFETQATDRGIGPLATVPSKGECGPLQAGASENLGVDLVTSSSTRAPQSVQDKACLVSPMKPSQKNAVQLVVKIERSNGSLGVNVLSNPKEPFARISSIAGRHHGSGLVLGDRILEINGIMCIHRPLLAVEVLKRVDKAVMTLERDAAPLKLNAIVSRAVLERPHIQKVAREKPSPSILNGRMRSPIAPLDARNKNESTPPNDRHTTVRDRDSVKKMSQRVDTLLLKSQSGQKLRPAQALPQQSELRTRDSYAFKEIVIGTFATDDMRGTTIHI